MSLVGARPPSPTNLSSRGYDSDLELQYQIIPQTNARSVTSHPTDQSFVSTSWKQSLGQYSHVSPPMQHSPYHHTSHSGTTPDYFPSQEAYTPSNSNQVFQSPTYTAENFVGGDYSASASPFNGMWEPSMDGTETHAEIFPELGTMPSHQSLEAFPEHINPQVLTPQSSNISTPPNTHDMSKLTLTRSQTGGSGSITSQPIAIPAPTTHRPSLTVNSRLTPAQSGPSSEASPLEATNRMPSPIVLVSSYKRGDSPSRTSHRPTHKRSRSSRSSMHLNPDQSQESSDDDDDDDRSFSQAQADDDLPEERMGYSGVDPTSREDIYVPSLQDLEEVRRIAEKNTDVEDWLEKSEAGSNADPDDMGSLPVPLRKKISRRRAVSAGGPTLGLGIVNQRQPPGPGLLVDEDVDEESDEEEEQISDSSGSGSPPVPVYAHTPEPGYFPPEIIPPVDVKEEDEEPLPRQFIRAQPWHDPFKGGVIDEQNQPPTARDAMHRYELQSAKFETASRAATWGTRRRISESDIRSLLSDESSLRRLSITPSPGGDRSSSRKSSIFGPMLDQARGMIRRTSINKGKTPPPPPSESSPTRTTPIKKRDSTGTTRALQRIPSFGRGPKSPQLNTSSALMAMTGQIAAVGGSGTVGPSGITSTTANNRTKSIKRQRSKSDIPTIKSSGSPGLAVLMTNHGGPPMPTLASPMQERARPMPPIPRPTKFEEDDDEDDEDEDDEMMQDRGIKMDLNVRTANIVPDLEGFKTHVRELNPRIEPFLLERIAQEQVRRYKKLVEHKVKHAQAVQRAKKCPSGKHCKELGGGPVILEPRKSNKDPTATTQFAVAGVDDSEDEGLNNVEGAVNSASFPDGIPVPQVKRLPAEFECNLCFKVKKFQKPSDWTKHVHEDVQPFTCTFPRCTEPKSFKRKADWVRHENERHRQLEWWRCNIPECNHICYRKDNFVQHLVREHKKPEPKLKPRGSVNKAAIQEAREVEEVWRLVEECRHETKEKPESERCKFCGNVCNSWKRLTVHLARHMEQISLPVLSIVERQHVSPDTVISPSPAHRKPAYDNSVSPGILFKVEDEGSYIEAGHPLMHQGSASPMPSSMFYTHQQMQQVHPNQNFASSPMQYPTSIQFGSPTHDMGAFPEQMGYTSTPYTMNAFTSQPSGPINNPTASTYPPPFNAIPRHLQRPSPAPSHTSHGSHPDFGVTVDPMYGNQGMAIGVDQPIFQSPVEGPMAFQSSPSMNMNMSGYPATSQGQFVGQHMGQQAMQQGYISPHSNMNGNEQQRGQQGYGF